MADATALPERAQQVFDAISEGRSPKDIADELGISRNAVYQHISKLRRMGLLSGRSHTPQRQPVRADPLRSVQETIQEFARRLQSQIDAIDQRGLELEQELKRLHEERAKVVETLEKLGVYAATQERTLFSG